MSLADFTIVFTLFEHALLVSCPLGRIQGIFCSNRQSLQILLFLHLSFYQVPPITAGWTGATWNENFPWHFYTWPTLRIEPQTLCSWVQCPIHSAPYFTSKTRKHLSVAYFHNSNCFHPWTFLYLDSFPLHYCICIQMDREGVNRHLEKKNPNTSAFFWEYMRSVQGIDWKS